MKKLAGVFLVIIAALLIALPLWASIADDMKAKKPMAEVMLNARLAGIGWDEIVCQAVKAGGDSSEVLLKALELGADPQLVQKGAGCAGVSDAQVRQALATFAAQKESEAGSTRSGVTPLMPIAPNYSSGGGGGGTPASRSY